MSLQSIRRGRQRRQLARGQAGGLARRRQALERAGLPKPTVDLRMARGDPFRCGETQAFIRQFNLQQKERTETLIERRDALARFRAADARLETPEAVLRDRRGSAEDAAERWLKAQGLSDDAIALHSLEKLALLKKGSPARDALDKVLRRVRRLRERGFSRSQIEAEMNRRTVEAQRKAFASGTARRPVNINENRWLELVFYENY